MLKTASIKFLRARQLLRSEYKNGATAAAAAFTYYNLTKKPINVVHILTEYPDGDGANERIVLMEKGNEELRHRSEGVEYSEAGSQLTRRRSLTTETLLLYVTPSLVDLVKRGTLLKDDFQ